MQPPFNNVGWILALVAAVLALVFTATGSLNLITGGLIGLVALAVMFR